MRRNRKPNIEVVELFLAKADWNRTFIGTIERFTNPDSSKFISGKVPVHDCTIWSLASDDKELQIMLDGIVSLILDHNLHCGSGRVYYINEDEYFLN